MKYKAFLYNHITFYRERKDGALMKMSKAEGIAVLLTVLLLSLALGFYVGRSTVKDAVVIEAAEPEVISPLESVVPAEPKTALESVSTMDTSVLSEEQSEPDAPDYPLDINNATLDDLDELPKIGPVLAQRIIDYRTANGDFQFVEELMNVEGIGEGIFEKIKEFVEVRNES